MKTHRKRYLSLLTAVALSSLFLAEGMALEITGHRGASFDAPENTLAAVNLAWEQNADAVEIDVFLSRDGRIVVVHDETTKRYGGPDKKIADQTLAELKSLDVGRWKDPKWAGERIPTLAEILPTIPEGKRLLIEIKCGPEIIAELKRVLKRSGKPPSQTAVIGFSHETMAAVKRALPELAVYWVVRLKRDEQTGKWSPGVGELIRKCKAAWLDGLHLGNSPAVINRGFVRRVQDARLGIYVWTVNDRKEAGRLKRIGVDGITTDRPGWLREELSDERNEIGVEHSGELCQHIAGVDCPAAISVTADPRTANRDVVLEEAVP